ncbi:hypothetical protein A3860_34470 [Niastella vici]|uniref:Uncharacterized protein n=1 Tax=Niastella vici TaxID=1703345 RepID=A0A1V9FPK7_9BACT|nr:hypothetical protein [Niastella vici]OQP60186.1 hypothetical protein A3860_34470 [Niastella vici]
MYHAAGMNLVYEQVKMCYVFPQNEFYQFLKLQNTKELHDEKYNFLLIKGIFGEDAKLEIAIDIENEEVLNLMEPQHHFNSNRVSAHRLPEPNDDIFLGDTNNGTTYHHFLCYDIHSDIWAGVSDVSVRYVSSYDNLNRIICFWFDEIANKWIYNN